jgi:hypothetical protein
MSYLPQISDLLVCAEISDSYGTSKLDFVILEKDGITIKLNTEDVAEMNNVINGKRTVLVSTTYYGTEHKVLHNHSHFGQ